MENRTYIVYYTCPKCSIEHCVKKKCTKPPLEESYLILTTPGKTAARKLFDKIKPCIYMHPTKVERRMYNNAWKVDKIYG